MAAAHQPLTGAGPSAATPRVPLGRSDGSGPCSSQASAPARGGHASSLPGGGPPFGVSRSPRAELPASKRHGPRDARVLELDGLRALAVGGVIAFHYSLGMPWANPATRLGWVGVDLFFVLSGYLITTILLHSRQRPRYFRTFYARRTLRIFPIYFLLLAIYASAALLLGGRQPTAYWAMQAAFLSSTVEFFRSWRLAAPEFVLAGVTVLWSLSIEEQFYLLWAPVVRWMRPAGLWLALGTAMVAAPALRLAAHTRYFPEYRFFPARFDSLAWGAALALALDAWPRQRIERGLRAAGFTALGMLAALAAFTGLHRANAAFAGLGYSALAMGFAAVVGWTVTRAGGTAPAARLLRLRPACWLGRVSYAVYLVHYPLLVLAGGALGVGAHAGMAALLEQRALGLTAALLLAGASWRWLEAPILRFKDRWAPAPRIQAEPQAGDLRIQPIVEPVS